MKPKLTGLPPLIAGFAVVLLVQALFVASYVGALHSPKPRDVALAVVGPNAFPTAVGKQVSLHIIRYSSESSARHAIDQRDVYGAFVSGPAGSKLIVAPAAGPAVATGLTTAFGAAAAATHQRLAIVQVHPLPRNDSSGSVAFLVTMALVVGGYLSATIARAVAGEATQGRRGVVLACAAVLGALVTDIIAGPIYGALPTSKFLVLWGLFTFVMMAVAFATAALQTLVGAAGTMIVIVVFVIFGAPAAGGAVPSSLLPTLWGTVGPFLPAGAGTTAVRNTLYFDGNAILQPLIVLGAYLVAGAAVVLSIRRKRRLSGTRSELEEASAAAAVIV